MKKETLKLVKTIVLNGKIDHCLTGDEQEQATGIKTVSKQKRFNGEMVEVEMGFAFTQRLEEEIGWAYKNADVTYMISDKPIKNPEKAMSDYIKFISGAPRVSRHHSYSDLTGYLWTSEDFKIGGHDMLNVLNANFGKYIHIEIDLYAAAPVVKKKK